MCDLLRFFRTVVASTYFEKRFCVFGYCISFYTSHAKTEYIVHCTVVLGIFYFRYDIKKYRQFNFIIRRGNTEDS